MNPTDIRLDQFGFPIPPTFSGLPAKQDATPVEDVPPTPPRRRAAKVILLLMLFGCLGMALVHAELPVPLGRSIADWLVSHAEQKYQEDDLPGALAALDRAIAWDERSVVAFRMRGLIRLETDDPQGALGDFNKLVDLVPHSTVPFMLRAQAFQRIDRHDAAIRDMTQAVRLRRPLDPLPLNARAYARAIAGVELDEALKDVNDALELDGQNAAYIDTKGYILFLQGEHEAARKEMDRALAIAEAERPPFGFLAAGGNARQRTRINRERRAHDHDLAVMYHHRGEILEKLGQEEAAQRDLRRGDELGYNPAAGVY